MRRGELSGRVSIRTDLTCLNDCVQSRGPDILKDEDFQKRVSASCISDGILQIRYRILHKLALERTGVSITARRWHSLHLIFFVHGSLLNHQEYGYVQYSFWEATDGETARLSEYSAHPLVHSKAAMPITATTALTLPTTVTIAAFPEEVYRLISAINHEAPAQHEKKNLTLVTRFPCPAVTVSRAL